MQERFKIDGYFRILIIAKSGKMLDVSKKGLESWGDTKTQLYLESSRKYYWNADQLEKITDQLPLDRIKHVADLGTGQGFFAFYLLSVLAQDAVVHGIDISKELLEKARQVALVDKKEVHFKQASIYELPFATNSLDLITEQLVFLHLSTPEVALQEIYRCLSPFGYAIFVEPNNTAVTLVDDTAKRLLSNSEFMNIVSLELGYNRGKKILGQGDSNIGDVLPKYFQQTGFKIIDSRVVDRVNIITPPYTKDHLEILDFLYGEASYNQWYKLYFDYCIASGMDEGDFAKSWKSLQKLNEIRNQQIINQEFHGVNAKMDYIYLVKKHV